MTGKHYYLTDRSHQRFKQLLRNPQQESTDTNSQFVPSFPMLARASNDIQQFQKGVFVLQRNKPGGLEDSTTTRSAYALCGISSGDICRLRWYAGESSGGYWGAVPCSGAEADPPDNTDTTACAAMDDGKLNASVTVTVANAVHNADPIGYPAGWVAQNVAIINAGVTCTRIYTEGRRSVRGRGLTLDFEPSERIMPSCQRGKVEYYSLPAFTRFIDGAVGEVDINGMAIRTEIQAFTDGSETYQWGAKKVIEWGTLDGDPLTTGKFTTYQEFGFWGPDNISGQILWSQFVTFSSTVSTTPLTSGTTDLDELQPFLGQPDHSWHFDFAPSDWTVTHVAAAPPKIAVVNLQSELPTASQYQSGETVVVCNDGANTGVYVATGAKGGAASSWTKS